MTGPGEELGEDVDEHPSHIGLKLMQVAQSVGGTEDLPVPERAADARSANFERPLLCMGRTGTSTTRRTSTAEAREDTGRIPLAGAFVSHGLHSVRSGVTRGGADSEHGRS